MDGNCADGNWTDEINGGEWGGLLSISMKT
jgi:hypothetical protein